jgi:4-hydroxybenzoate polyprenyltransferase
MTFIPGKPAASQVAQDPTDIHHGGWVDRWLPGWAEPYGRLARLDRPIGTWLLLFPGWWGIALASPAWPDPVLLLMFAIGAVVMRGAGCTLNDIADREYDAKVARTRLRPLPSGRVTVSQAIVFMAAQLLVGAAILVSLNRACWWLGAGVLVLIGTYPFMKRITYWPQLFLGLNFNWGALLGWTAVTSALAWPPVLLYFGGIFWTLGYDTIYAHQDKEDDALIGVKSSARWLESWTRPALYLFYGAAVALFAVTGWLAGLAAPFYGLLGAGAVQLAWQAARIDIDDPVDCLAMFKSNRVFGWLMLAAIVAGRIAA